MYACVHYHNQSIFNLGLIDVVDIRFFCYFDKFYISKSYPQSIMKCSELQNNESVLLFVRIYVIKKKTTKEIHILKSRIDRFRGKILKLIVIYAFKLNYAIYSLYFD